MTSTTMMREDLVMIDNYSGCGGYDDDDDAADDDTPASDDVDDR